MLEILITYLNNFKNTKLGIYSPAFLFRKDYMENKNFKEKFGSAIEVLEIINKAGFESYFVGGCVRDYILKKNFSDIDITSNALPDEIKRIFPKTIDTGIQHGTVTVLYKNNSYEITTFRTEDDYSNHRAPNKVEFVNNLKDDLDRRDFTINAMAFDINGNLYDFHSGINDISNKIIKTVKNPNERFFEDALRMIRAFRFSSKLGFNIENDTFNAICKNSNLIEFVSIERIITEFKKLFEGKGCKKSFELLLKSGINVYIPFFKYTKNYTDFSKYTFCQSMYYLMYFNNIPISELKKLKLSNKEISKVKEYDSIHNNFRLNIPIEKILYLYSIEDVIFISRLFNLMDYKKISSIKLNIESFNDVNITSKEIIELVNRTPGPWIKDIMKKIEDNILLGKLKNDNKEIIEFIKKSI